MRCFIANIRGVPSWHILLDAQIPEGANAQPQLHRCVFLTEAAREQAREHLDSGSRCLYLYLVRAPDSLGLGGRVAFLLLLLNRKVRVRADTRKS